MRQGGGDAEKAAAQAAIIKNMGPVTAALYDAIVIILRAGGGRCRAKDVYTAITWDVTPNVLYKSMERLVHAGLIQRHGRGRDASFLTLPGPRLDGQAAPGLIPKHILCRLDLPDPFARETDAEEEIPDMETARRMRQDASPPPCRHRERRRAAKSSPPAAEPCWAYAHAAREAVARIDPKDTKRAGELMTPRDVERLYAGARYGDYKGRERLPNVMPGRDPARHLAQGASAGAVPGAGGVDSAARGVWR